MDVTTAHLLHQYRVQISDLEDENKRLREQIEWLDNNTTFYNTDESDGPVLASVSKRIWYHATDDTVAYPFSALLKEGESE